MQMLTRWYHQNVSVDKSAFDASQGRLLTTESQGIGLANRGLGKIPVVPHARPAGWPSCGPQGSEVGFHILAADKPGVSAI